MLMTSSRRIMGERVNSRMLSTMGWITTAAVTLATAGLIVTWLR
jgi:Mn2+/Fe2+ NRAMP family transporter